MPILIVLGAAAIAGPVLAAVGELVHILLIAVAVIGGLAAVGLVAFIAYRIRHRDTNADRAVYRITPAEPRPARALPQTPRAIGQPAVHIHHHWHGVDAEDVAAIIRHQQEGR
jgi:hypothetical protein